MRQGRYIKVYIAAILFIWYIKLQYYFVNVAFLPIKLRTKKGLSHPNKLPLNM